jgi:hypothetical protein
VLAFLAADHRSSLTGTGFCDDPVDGQIWMIGQQDRAAFQPGMFAVIANPALTVGQGLFMYFYFTFCIVPYRSQRPNTGLPVITVNDLININSRLFVQPDPVEFL